MPITSAYTDIADYILDQLWGFASGNVLKSNVQYLSELLGDPSDNSDTLDFEAISADASDLVATEMTSVGSNSIIDKYTRSTGTSVGVRGVAISASSGSFSTSAATPTNVTNLSVTITTSGRPVFLRMFCASTGDTSGFVSVAEDTGAVEADVTIEGIIIFVRDSTILNYDHVRFEGRTQSDGEVRITVPASSFGYIDPVAAGTYTYKVQAESLAGNTVSVSAAKLAAFEL